MNSAATTLPEIAPAVLSCERLSKVYRMGEIDVHALQAVDLTLHAGELMVLLGVSGQTIDNLRREGGLPCKYLNKRNRVYMTSDVLKWIASRM